MARVTRRELLTTAPAVGTGLATMMAGEAAEAAAAPRQGETMRGVPFARTERVRVGFIGLGGRGSYLLGDLLSLEGVEVRAVCDSVPAHAERGKARVEKAGKPAPAVYAGSDTVFEQLCRRDDLDLVFIATPWDWHVPMAVSAMEHGKHAAVEVPAATTLDECWKLVDASEKARRHCVMLENCCYGETELLVWNMAKDGLFGELTHAEAAYIHDLRGTLLADSSEGLWRRVPHVKRNGNLYPTHGLGPVAQYLDIDRGDRFETLVAMSSREASLSAFRDAHVAADNPKREEKYACGDMNTSLIRTAKGRTIMLQHDVVTPRPYSRNNSLFGTNGGFVDYPPRVYVDGQSKGEEWETLARFKEKYAHPLWKQMGDLARQHGGHGGMDFLMLYRLVQCVREGMAPDMDVYDAASWSTPGPLSEQSIAKGSAPVKFPDFTRGHWKRNSPVAG